MPENDKEKLIGDIYNFYLKEKRNFKEIQEFIANVKKSYEPQIIITAIKELYDSFYLRINSYNYEILANLINLEIGILEAIESSDIYDSYFSVASDLNLNIRFLKKIISLIENGADFNLKLVTNRLKLKYSQNDLYSVGISTVSKEKTIKFILEKFKLEVDFLLDLLDLKKLDFKGVQLVLNFLLGSSNLNLKQAKKMLFFALELTDLEILSKLTKLFPQISWVIFPKITKEHIKDNYKSLLKTKNDFLDCLIYIIENKLRPIFSYNDHSTEHIRGNIKKSIETLEIEPSVMATLLARIGYDKEFLNDLFGDVQYEVEVLPDLEVPLEGG